MKVAISLPDPVFSAAEHLAHRLKVSRSQLYAQAIQEYLGKRQDSVITERLNAVYGVESGGIDAALMNAQLGLLVMKRSEIWRASLPSPVASGRGYKRPVLVIQANPFNASRISTVIVAVITSNLALAEAPGNVRVGKSDSGLTETSVVNVSQIITIDRGILSKKVKALSGAAMEKVAEGLKLVLALP